MVMSLFLLNELVNLLVTVVCGERTASRMARAGRFSWTPPPWLVSRAARRCCTLHHPTPHLGQTVGCCGLPSPLGSTTHHYTTEPSPRSRPLPPCPPPSEQAASFDNSAFVDSDDPTPLLESYQLNDMLEAAGGVTTPLRRTPSGSPQLPRPLVSSPTRIEHPNLPPLNLHPHARSLRRSTLTRRDSDTAPPPSAVVLTFTPQKTPPPTLSCDYIHCLVSTFTPQKTPPPTFSCDYIHCLVYNQPSVSPPSLTVPATGLQSTFCLSTFTHCPSYRFTINLLSLHLHSLSQLQVYNQPSVSPPSLTVPATGLQSTFCLSTFTHCPSYRFTINLLSLHLHSLSQLQVYNQPSVSPPSLTVPATGLQSTFCLSTFTHCPSYRFTINLLSLHLHSLSQLQVYNQPSVSPPSLTVPATGLQSTFCLSTFTHCPSYRFTINLLSLHLHSLSQLQVYNQPSVSPPSLTVPATGLQSTFCLSTFTHCPSYRFTINLLSLHLHSLSQLQVYNQPSVSPPSLTVPATVTFLAKYGHSVLRLPLLNPDLNPIELMWVLVKDYISSKVWTFCPTSTPTQSRSQPHRIDVGTAKYGHSVLRLPLLNPDLNLIELMWVLVKDYISSKVWTFCPTSTPTQSRSQPHRIDIGTEQRIDEVSESIIINLENDSSDDSSSKILGVMMAIRWMVWKFLKIYRMIERIVDRDLS
uniref:(California timema) hypothetical protein n=1 Tax=Timema californicum TaxID=61474 RepID=A0A7R9J9Z0_TIMCA|nr:unnamed protein product [Timema californicum]